ncbi:hypothetical protein Bbelb_384230 [Branchiostoma belcheri]|nr:hypothetical protein Bbelb_384230 [Branchiostoma belcheri]
MPIEHQTWSVWFRAFSRAGEYWRASTPHSHDPAGRQFILSVGDPCSLSGVTLVTSRFCALSAAAEANFGEREERNFRSACFEVGIRAINHGSLMFLAIEAGRERVAGRAAEEESLMIFDGSGRRDGALIGHSKEARAFEIQAPCTSQGRV